MLNKLLLSEEELEQEKLKDFVQELGKGIQVLVDTYGKEALLKKLEE